MTEKYDLIVIGGGTAGLLVSDFGVKLGAKILLVEANKIGGDCTCLTRKISSKPPI